MKVIIFQFDFNVGFLEVIYLDMLNRVKFWEIYDKIFGLYNIFFVQYQKSLNFVYFDFVNYLMVKRKDFDFSDIVIFVVGIYQNFIFFYVYVNLCFIKLYVYRLKFIQVVNFNNEKNEIIQFLYIFNK